MHIPHRTSKEAARPLVPSVFKALVVATVLGRLSESACDTITSIVVGQLVGSAQLAAISLVQPLDIMAAMVANLIALGSSFLCAYYMGDGKEREVNSTFSLSVGLLAFFGTVFTVLYAFAAEPIVALMGGRGELAQCTIDYMHGTAAGFIPYFTSRILLEAIALNGSKDLAVRSTVASSVTDLLAALASLYVFKLGIFGVGLSVSLASWACVAVCLAHFRRPRNTLALVRPTGIDEKLVKIFRGGSSQGFSRGGVALQAVVRNGVLLACGGPEALAAMRVVMSINNLFTSTVLTCNYTVQSMVSMFFGEHDRTAIEDTSQIAAHIEAVLTGFWTIALLAVPNLFCVLFGLDDSQAYDFGVVLLRLYALGLFFAMLRQLFTSVQNALNRTAISWLGTVGQTVLAYIPLILLLPGVWGINGAFAALPLSELLAFAVCAVFAAMKGGNILRPRTWTLLPANWGQEREVVFAIDGSPAAYEAAYETINDFCAAEGVSHKTSDLAAHTAEELALLILAHRRTEQDSLGRLQRVGKTVTGAGAEQKTAVEYRLVVIGDELSLRLRCAGLPYNPLAAERVAGSFELQLIDMSTSSQDYRHALGINNLILRIRK